MTADVELLPCPFCGAKLHEHEHSFVHPHPSPAHGFCLIAGLSFRRDQLDFWSRRTPDAKDAEIEALRNERDFLVDEYERAVGCGPQGYTHAAMHLFNAITNAQVDQNAKFIEALRAEVAEWKDLDRRINANFDLLEARAERLEEAGRRVTAAFRAHGEATPFTREAERTRHECEAAMLALDATTLHPTAAQGDEAASA